MTTLAIVLISISGYLLVGWRLAKWNAPREWAKQLAALKERAPNLAKDPVYAEQRVGEEARLIGWLWFLLWPFMFAFRGLNRAMRPALEHGNPFEAERINRELTAERDRLQAEITRMERQLGIKKWNQS